MKKKKVSLIIGGQWGDQGKGKIIDVLADEADVIARTVGGNNAGTTVVIGSKNYVLHLVPSGIIRPHTMNVIGNGVVVDPRGLCKELEGLRKVGVDYSNRLKIALNAKLTLPEHFLVEALRESGRGAVGSTMRGISPTYTDHVGRVGLIVNDMLNPALFAELLERNLEEKRWMLEHFGRRYVRKVMRGSASLEHGRFYSPDGFFNVREIVRAYREYARELAPFIDDTDAFVQQRLGRSVMLIESAQGTFISIDHGTYPNVTSSDTTRQGTMKGAGLRDSDADAVYVVMKVPYETRVGKGAFPTEMGGKRMEEWCERRTPCDQEPLWESPDINSRNELEQGIAVLKGGREFGSTTGRRRRCGWYDAVLGRKAIQINGGKLILTKLDVMSGCKRLKICTHYIYEGPTMHWGQEVFRKGDRIDEAIARDSVLRHCNPQYVEVAGWSADLSKLWRWNQLPARCKAYVEKVAELTGAKLSAISVGPDRDATIWL